MNDQSQNIILVTNGHPATKPSLEFGIYLAASLKLPIRLLAVQESSDHEHPVEEAVTEMQTKMESSGIPFEVVNLTGNVEDLVKEKSQNSCEMIILGPLGRPFIYQFIHGHSFRRFMEDLEVPILYVSDYQLPVNKILVCMGGLGYAQEVLEKAIHLAKPIGASITILHVVENISLDYPLAHEVHDHWKDLMTTDTPQGRNLRKAMSELQEMNIENELILRHGNIISEIIEEINSGKYGLICMGSMFSSKSIRHFALPNITAEIAETVKYPILSVRNCIDP